MGIYVQAGAGLFLRDFYLKGPSLWRWVKYGHGKAVIYDDPFSKKSLTAPSAPHVQKRIQSLMTKPLSLPSILQNRALLFLSSSDLFSNATEALNAYPGDGYLFFMDPYFTADSRHPRYASREAFSFYNYLYSYRDLMTPALFKHLSRISSKTSIHVLYEYRFNIFRETYFFNELNILCAKKPSQEEFELALLERLIGHYQKNTEAKAKIPKELHITHVMSLLEAYDIEAVRRILFGPSANLQSIMNSVSLVTETRSLINGPLPQKFTSPSALRIFHDVEAERLLAIAQENNPALSCEYSWHPELVDLVDAVCEGAWRIPVTPFELIFRGNSHLNCIGSYFNRHFAKPSQGAAKALPRKTLIVLSDEAEAEIQISFEKKDRADKSTGEVSSALVCSRAKVIQCKTKFNRNYPTLAPERICAALKGRDAGIFEPFRTD
ncbi:MAG: PcfJ domain-containing protein [Treponema sp.]|nr:PcfJ domain-containing protein [Treponema sp.]